MRGIIDKLSEMKRQTSNQNEADRHGSEREKLRKKFEKHLDRLPEKW